MLRRELSVRSRSTEKGRPRFAALDGVSVEFGKGEFTAIMGPSGSGKSTLLHCLAGLDWLTGGEVWIGDQRLGDLSDRDLTRLRRDRVGFIFQAYNLIPTLDAEENITLPMDIAGRKPDQAWVDQVVGTLRLEDRLDHRPSQLSGGQQQRVAAARALPPAPRSSSQTSRAATSTPAPALSCSSSFDMPSANSVRRS